MPGKDLAALTEKHFQFLCDQYDFRYHAGENIVEFESKDLLIKITLGRFRPYVMIWLKSEPEFTKRSLRSYVRYLEDLEISEIYGSREESFELSAALLRTHLGKIRSENAQLLAEVLKLNFRAALKPLTVNMDYDSLMFIESDRDFQSIVITSKSMTPIGIRMRSWQP